MTHFLEKLSDAIDIQQQRQDQEYNELMERPLRERVNRGYTMTNLHAEFEFYDGAPSRFVPAPTGTLRYISRVHIHCEYNISKFREGTQVRLSHGSHSFIMEIEQDDVNDFVLRSSSYEYQHNMLDIRNYPKDGWEVNAVNSNITQRLLRATWENLYGNPDYCEHLERFLTGQFRNQYCESPSPDCGNPSQNEAIRKSFVCSYFHLIQGPPGTGKTFTIAKIVYYLMKMGKKVFVTAPTHTAINNCLNAIANELQDKRFVVKVGERHQADEIVNNPHITRRKSLKLYDYQHDSELSQDGFVVGGTPFAPCSPASKKLDGWLFDYVIMDEAAQMSIPLALPAIMRGSRLIFVGDHQQLDPIVPQDTGNRFFDGSIFKRLADLYPQDITLLDQSYRLNENLISIPNRLFYSGRIAAKHALQQPYTDFNCPSAPQIVRHPSNELLVIHHEFDSLGRSPYEANLTADISTDLLRNGVPVSEIGIMSPYRAQIREIRRALLEKVGEEVAQSIFVDTVERMQGQEKDYIIYSMSNSNPAEVEDHLEFFYSPNRLNVALTRARVKCVVLANEKIFTFCGELLQNPSTPLPLRNGAEIFSQYYKTATKLEMITEEEDW
ncbi:MAG: AAA domain-containing protein [Bacteroidales bacterium]|nr:AAA domain-containing protein [Bacteroidales bacterium]